MRRKLYINKVLLKLIRTYHQTETQGVLYVDDQYFGATIEPPYGKGTHLHDKRYPSHNRHKGCIPEGWYRIRITYSPRFNREMPLLQQVPGFEGIRIHAGKIVKNTKGCICIGERWRENKLTQLLTHAQERNETIYIAIATDYSLTRQLSDTDEFDWYPACTVRE